MTDHLTGDKPEQSAPARLELLPCPFCGSKPERVYYEPHSHPISGMPTFPGAYSVECLRCEFQIFDHESESVADTRWNTRHNADTGSTGESAKNEVPPNEPNSDEQKDFSMIPTDHLKTEPIEHPFQYGTETMMLITGYRILQWWSEDGKELLHPTRTNAKGEWRYLDGCEP